jgi:hypothetical protein
MFLLDISPNKPVTEILDFVKKWFKLLADDKLEEGCAMLLPNSYGIVWTPDLIKQTMNEIYSPDTWFYHYHPEGPIFSDPYDLGKQRFEEAIETPDGYAFDYDVPLNGEWSDLTAQFQFIKQPNGYAVVLEDLHIM